MTGAERNFSSPTKEVLEDLFYVKRISFEKMSFVQGLKRWLSCFKSGRHLLKIILSSEMLAECLTCNTVQMMYSCDAKAGVVVAVRDGEGNLSG